MAQFVTGQKLNATIEDIIEKADELLVLISPYIKLHQSYERSLMGKIENDNLEIVVVFGKNEDHKSKSMEESTLNFFKKFPNILIKYEPRLHAKYYANDDTALITSMNLYEFSQNENVEVGVITKSKLIELNSESVDKKSWEFFEGIIAESELIFESTPVYENADLLGITKRYTHSKIVDNSEGLEYKKRSPAKVKKGMIKSVANGYCIRTGVKIPFNPKKPLSDRAFNSWNKYKDENFKEKYCHYSGEESNGETSFNKPILRRNWSKAKLLIS